MPVHDIVAVSGPTPVLAFDADSSGAIAVQNIGPQKVRLYRGTDGAADVNGWFELSAGAAYEGSLAELFPGASGARLWAAADRPTLISVSAA